MEIPLELMISISKDPPWIFHPNFIPLGHPIFDIINSTDAEVTFWCSFLHITRIRRSFYNVTYSYVIN
jgi:hypothetical protein